MGVRGYTVTRAAGRANEASNGKIQYAPPSQAAILVFDKRIGSWAIISIALRGWG